jgi:YfiH family protein
MRITSSDGERYLFKQKGAIGYYVCPDLDDTFIHGFSTKLPSTGGCSRTEEINRQRQEFCNALQIKAPSLLRLQQVHGDRIFVAKEPVSLLAPGEYDGAVTDSTQVALSIVTADCLPILIYEQSKKIIGAVHAGWRGASLGILRNALAAIQQTFGGSPRGCIVLMGPALRPCCFEIQHDVLKILQERLSYWPQVINTIQNRFYFDLQLTNLLQATQMGVPHENIWTVDLCTFCHPAWFHSYRRDKSQAGRMISLISLS